MRKVSLLLLSLMLISPATTQAISLNTETTQNLKNKTILQKKINDFLLTRQDRIQTKSYDNKIANKYDEAFSLITFMETKNQLKSSSLETKFSLDKINVDDYGTTHVIGTLEQKIHWKDEEFYTALSDQVDFTFDHNANLINNTIPTIEYNQQQIKDKALSIKKETVENNSELKPEISAAPLAITTLGNTYTYNRAGAVQYAIDHYNTPNADYVDYTNTGGDCTNFASQNLREGGGIQIYIQSNASDDNPSWYYNKNAGGWLKSYSWVNADKFFRLLRNYSTISTSAKSSVLQLSLGDIITYDHGAQGKGTPADGEMDHNATLTKIVNKFDPGTSTYYNDYYVTYRTNNRLNVDWAFYMLGQPANTITVAYYTHINDIQAYN